jgi:solute carrier family 26 protein
MPLPSELVLLIFATLISYLAKFSSKDVFNMKVVGRIPQGFPAPSVPVVSRFPVVFPDAFAIALVSFTINISMGKLLAKRHSYNLDSNQELMAYGITNICSSFLNCFVSTASLSRSIVQETVGGKTQVVYNLRFTITLYGPYPLIFFNQSFTDNYTPVEF